MQHSLSLDEKRHSQRPKSVRQKSWHTATAQLSIIEPSVGKFNKKLKSWHTAIAQLSIIEPSVDKFNKT